VRAGTTLLARRSRGGAASAGSDAASGLGAVDSQVSRSVGASWSRSFSAPWWLSLFRWERHRERIEGIKGVRRRG
jgi:hypothetical protein